MIRVLDRENTIFNRFIAQMRDVNVQGDSMRFRRNLERAGEVMAYEISKTLHYTKHVVETPLGEAEVSLPDDQLVIATILRAGIPFHQGFLNYFDDAQNAFVSAYRKYSKDGSFHIKVEYISSCELTGKTLLLVDPMLATGASLALTYQALLEKAGETPPDDRRYGDRQRGGDRVREKEFFDARGRDLVRNGGCRTDGEILYRSRDRRCRRSGLRR